MRRVLLAATALVLAGMSSAFGQTFTYQGFTVDPNNVSVTITSPVSRTVLAGQITLDGAGPNAGQTIAAYCLDLMDTLQTGPYTYQETTLSPGLVLAGFPTGGLNATQIQEIGDLMLTNGVNNDKAAAQLAIWKIMFGNSFATLGVAGQLATDENADLADVQAGGSLFNPNVDIVALHDAVTAPNQTLGFAVPVPGPIVGAGVPGLIMASLGMVMIGRRRRSA